MVIVTIAGFVQTSSTVQLIRINKYNILIVEPTILVLQVVDSVGAFLCRPEIGSMWVKSPPNDRELLDSGLYT